MIFFFLIMQISQSDEYGILYSLKSIYIMQKNSCKKLLENKFSAFDTVLIILNNWDAYLMVTTLTYLKDKKRDFYAKS